MRFTAKYEAFNMIGPAGALVGILMRFTAKYGLRKFVQ